MKKPLATLNQRPMKAMSQIGKAAPKPKAMRSLRPILDFVQPAPNPVDGLKEGKTKEETLNGQVDLVARRSAQLPKPAWTRWSTSTPATAPSIASWCFRTMSR